MRCAVSLHRAGCCLAVLAAWLAVGCSQQDLPTHTPPQLVGGVTVKEQPVTISTNLAGRTVAYRIAQIRPQVNGVILQRTYTQGRTVQAGQQLYPIAPPIYSEPSDTA